MGILDEVVMKSPWNAKRCMIVPPVVIELLLRLVRSRLEKDCDAIEWLRGDMGMSMCRAGDFSHLFCSQRPDYLSCSTNGST